MSPSRKLAKLSFVTAPGMSLDEVRERLVNATLAYTDGNITRAAQLIGRNPKTLWRWRKAEDQPAERRERVPA